MVNQSIKVYARVKKGFEEKPTVPYDITTNKEDFEDLTFYLSTKCTLNNISGFRFHKVFNVNSLQADIFDTVAKPVITSVMEGFNGTIFAYGQTGSGKTYTMTGSANNYDERGIIPRSIQYIFQYYENVSEKPTIYISYLEIYNETGYDLLGTKQSNTTKTIDELPRVSLLEDKNGDAHIRNLNVFPVSTEQEAMRLLFLGDTNRKIAETASNEFSSRSHCIFTLYINLRESSSSNLRSSKLHIVDLAGSERLSKTNTKGPRVQEAKSINLSLHYLQHVILALSNSKRTHIPYRNSFLTHMLRDSLNGKSVTSMLATISAKKLNIEETISTCRFAQRVSMISTDPVINVLDPQREIAFLKLKIDDLEKRLSTPTGFIDSKFLSKQKMDACVAKIKSFIGSNKGTINIEPDMTEVQFCFSLLKKEVENKKKECVDLEKSLVKRNSEISVLSEELNKKELEIANLKKLIDRIPENPAPVKYKPIDSPNSYPNKSDYVGVVHKPPTQYSKRPNTYEEKRLYEIFTSNPEVSETLNYYKRELEERLNVAKKCAKNIEVSQRKISNIKQKLDGLSSVTEKSQLLKELENQQSLYKAALDHLRLLQSETFRLQCDLKKAEGTSQSEGMSQSQFQDWKKDYCSSLFTPATFDLKEYKKMPLAITHYPLEGHHSNQVVKTRDNDQILINGPKTMKQVHFGRVQNTHTRPEVTSHYTKQDSHYTKQEPNVPDILRSSKKSTNIPSLTESTERYFSNNYGASILQNKNNLRMHKNNESIRYAEPSQSNIATQDSRRPVGCNDLVTYPIINFTQVRPYYAGQREDNLHLGNNSYILPEDLVATKESGCTIPSAENKKSGFYPKDSGLSIQPPSNMECAYDNLSEKNKSATPLLVSPSPRSEYSPKEKKCKEQEKNDDTNKGLEIYFIETDTTEFKEFMKNVTLTGSADIDKEIFDFYRSKFC
ncbi:kinesin-like protein KIF6 [Diabrotica undecimpunctata]|uniref:kinesin-like protein KIF6 n=1 Tax=Diabrotica undecimpunctata TaxID=50387 RepID=UPI003B640548